MNFEIYMMMKSVDIVRGGMTKALLKRANLLAGKFDHVNIITFAFIIEHDKIRQQLKKYGALHSNVTLYNMHDFLSRKNASYYYSDTMLDIEKEEKYNNELIICDLGYKKNICRDDNGNIKLVEYYNNIGQLYKREDYDLRDNLKLYKYFDCETGEVEREVYFENGNIFLEKTFNNSGKVKKIIWNDNKLKSSKEFSNENQLRKFYIQEIMKNSLNPVLISDARSTDKLLQSIDDPNISKILMLHSSHLLKPFNYSAPLHENNGRALKMMNDFDANVFLTNEQKNDIERRFGLRTTYHVIPHSASKVKVSSNVKRDYLKAVVVARFSAWKNIDHAIRAFSGVVKKFPEAKLEIWGFGKREEELKELINNLDLNENVFIKGFTTNSYEVFQGAAFSVMTSRTEGFGMVLTESLSVGTPVISYDIKYGPSDIIDDGKNGYLIKRNDINALQEAMIKLFDNPSLVDEMSIKAQKITDTLSDEKFVMQWANVFEKATLQKKQRLNIKSPDCKIMKMGWSDREKGLLDLQCKMNFDNDHLIKNDMIVYMYLKKRETLEDQYIPINIESTTKESIIFSSTINLSDFIVNEDIKEGILDFYISFSVMNIHHFIRIGNLKDEEVSLFNDYIKVNNITIYPYFTNPYGNLSVDIGQKKHAL
ncbi:putative poly(glycerol-phosphate) alpha-glucosyltransferase [Heyndrickxia sporothermodurans]|nr:putative poly(glycerol-phosphate) alpha-glucosyltransferase [Heyndrickxia sporothermodurans]